MRHSRVLMAAIAVLLSAGSLAAQIPLLAPSTAAQLEDLKGKILMIRGFYGGSNLHFDASGSLLEGGKQESWTLACVEVAEVIRRGNQIEIRGTRIALLYDNAAKEFRAVERKLSFPPSRSKPDKVTIIVDTPRSGDTAAATAVQRVFVSSADHLVDMVPEYWRALVAKFTHEEEQPEAATDKAAAPAANPPVEQGQGRSPANVVGEKAHTPDEVGAPVPASPPAMPFKVSGSVKAPRAISDPQPEYNDPARTAKVQGTTVLWVVVGSDGSVRKVRITKPIGFGLDDNAVAAVSRWRFAPATKDGQPVTVQVSIEVNFRLY